jgi:hypothetical protein
MMAAPSTGTSQTKTHWYAFWACDDKGLRMAFALTQAFTKINANPRKEGMYKAEGISGVNVPGRGRKGPAAKRHFPTGGQCGLTRSGSFQRA